MSAKHEAIKRQVMIDWTKFSRGTLWPNGQLTVNIKGRTIKTGLGKGTSDLVGIELYEDEIVDTIYGEVSDINIIGQWVSIEVKTRFANGTFDWLSPVQMKHCKTVLNNGGRFYLALEMPGCTVTKPKYMLRIVQRLDDLIRIKEEWRKEWIK